MESAGYRHRRSPSSDRFLGIFSFSPPKELVSGASAPVTGGGELIEAEVFWTNEFPEPSPNHCHCSSFSKPQNSGILAVLPETDRGSQLLCRKTSISPVAPSPVPSSSSVRSIPVIPRSLATTTATLSQSSQEREYSLSVPYAKLRQSAPMNVPVLANAMATRRNSLAFEAYDNDDDEDDDKVLPPHEIVARGSGVSPKTTFSVLEGVGRTLKGRDLRQVRNAIWRQTGFLD